MGRSRGGASPTDKNSVQDAGNGGGFDDSIDQAPPADAQNVKQRPIELRAERSGGNSRFLSATLDGDGNLVLSGQDLGPATAVVSHDGEYEWAQVIAAGDIPALLHLLDAPLDSDVLEVLAAQWTGPNSHELERLIRESEIPSKLWSWAG